MSGMWKRSHGRTSEAPPDERGGYRYVRPPPPRHISTLRDLPVGARPGPRKASRSVAVVAKSTAATGAVVAPSRAESRLAALASAGVVTSVMGSPPDHRIGGRQGKPCGSGTVGRSARSRLPG